MTIQVKHAFVSLKGDGTDNTQVQPSNWNAVHSVTLASGQLMGRLSGGIGAVEEIPISAYMANLLTATDVATLSGLLGLFETGDVKYTFKTTAAAGWLLVTTGGSIGDGSSGASLRGNADTWPLFQVVWNNVPDSLAPVNLGGRGANAAADFNAHKVITLPPLVGRSPIAVGSGVGLTTRSLGALYGEETHILSSGEMPSHNHSATDSGHNHVQHAATVYTASGPLVSGGTGGPINPVAGTTTAVGFANISIGLAGGGTPHNNMHPVIGLNVMVKL